MAASLSGEFNSQQFADNGVPLAGGRLYTYAYGTTTLKVAYTDAAGLVPHTYTLDSSDGQYIALNARGELPAPLYLAAGSYDLSLKRADGSTVWTRRADPITDQTALASTASGQGASLVGINDAGSLIAATTVEGALQEVATNVNTKAPLASPTFTGSPSVPSLNGGQLAGIRNLITNGSMGIDQRNAGAAQTITAGAALAYTVDRWYAACTGANVTGQRVAGTAPDLYAYRFTGAASVTSILFGQRIEQADCFQLAGTTATLSAVLSNSFLTSVTWTAYYANTADTFGTLASPTRTQIATGTFTVTSTATRYSTQIAIPSAATTGIEIVFSVGAQISGTWTIDNVQLEPGTTATPFERRPIAFELARCQRYFVSEAFIAFRYGPTVGSFNSTIYLPVSMRANPTATLSGLTYSNASGGTVVGASSVRSILVAATISTPPGEFSFGGTYAASAEL